jgi:hypothetical protein
VYGWFVFMLSTNTTLFNHSLHISISNEFYQLKLGMHITLHKHKPHILNEHKRCITRASNRTSMAINRSSRMVHYMHCPDPSQKTFTVLSAPFVVP